MIREVNEIDLRHLGHDRVIAAHAVDDLIVDPGPESCLEALLAGLEAEPRALLLTHIHLDHAGAAGSLVRRFPQLRVYVHERGAPHLVDPSRLLASATRLYGAEAMATLWGEVAPVPEANVSALRGGEEIEGLRVAYTPGHASHHVCYLDQASGECFTGDVAGVRVPPHAVVLMPTPPPDIDVEAWLESIDLVESWRPERLRLTHFGAVDDVGDHLARAREALGRYAAMARDLDRERFIAAVRAELEREAGSDPAAVARAQQAAPPEQLWLGLERYWRRRG